MRNNASSAAIHKTRHPFAAGLLLAVLLLSLSLAVILQALQGSQPATASGEPLDADTARELQELSGILDGVDVILEHSENYPASLLRLLAGNHETLDFVLQYPEHGIDTPADSVGDVTKGEIPLLLQWDPRWGYASYGSDFLAITGCGPTCLSMVAAGLTGNDSITPVVVAEAAEQGGHYAEGYGSSWTIMSQCSAEFGLTATELPLDEGVMLRALEEGKPIVCSMNAGDFTSSGHYIVLVGMENGAFRVHDPNSLERSGMLWSYERISGQIGNLWSFEAAG